MLSTIDNEPPVVRIEPRYQTVDEGKPVRFDCIVTGNTSPIEWRRSTGEINPEATTSRSGVLQIPRARLQDETGYYCKASNEYGTKEVRTVLYVTKVTRPQLNITVRQTKVSVVPGLTTELVCYTKDEPGRIALFWSRSNGLPPGSTQDNGVLTIPNVQPSYAGKYVCTGTEAETGRVGTSTVVLQVDAEPQTTPSPNCPLGDFQCVTPPLQCIDSRLVCDGVPDCSDASDEKRCLTRPPLTIIVRQTKVSVVAGQTAELVCYQEESGRITLFWSRSKDLPPGSTQDNGVLTIPNVQPSYAGKYVCTGTEAETGRVGTSTVVLQVDAEPHSVSPKAVVEPEKLTIPMGSTGTLRCAPTGTPQPTVKWIRSRSDLSANHQVSGNVLRIINATKEDRGIYVCRVENVAGLDQDWAVVEVERRIRPRVDIYPNTTQHVSVGGSALFQCRVMDGDPPPAVEWKRVGGLSMPADKVEIMQNGVIMFKRVTQAEHGSYICSATNEMGSTSATATLVVTGPPSLTISPSSVVNAIVGQRVALKCTATGQPTPTVYWVGPRQNHLDDLPVQVDLSYPDQEGYAVMDIARVERDDAGYYRCVARNNGGQTEDTVQLIVTNGEPEGVTIQGPSTMAVAEGQIVELVCSANAISNARIRWRRREGRLPPGHSVSNGVLTLPRFMNKYAGEYICSTVTQVNTYEASVIIFTVAPRVTLSPQGITSRAGDTIQLKCSASGNGPFNIEWSKVEGEMNPSTTERNGILEIRQVTAADAGRYRCVVQSSGGSSDGYAIVEVQVPPVITVTQREVYAEIGSTAELSCDVSGSPPPIVRWEKESGQLPPQHSIRDGVLTINNVQSSNTGRYICHATSNSGSARGVAFLKVDKGSVIDANQVVVDTQVVDVGDRISMECIITGTPPLPTITWSRDDGLLPEEAIIGDGIIIIPQARIQDAGTYTCLATNEAGSLTSKVILYVRGDGNGL